MTHNSSKSPAPLAFCRIRPATYRQSTDKERAVVVPQSKPFRSGKMLNANDIARDFLPETSSRRLGDTSGNVSGNISGNLDESTAVSSLKELIAAGDHRLDPMLATLTDAARQLTGASGAALAMWKDGAMTCRARSGDTAPALGARLSAETGISGECLRTGKIQHCTDTENDPLVDVEICRSLGLRSIAVLPIRGRRGINGILEVFSTHPVAFTEQHLVLLQQLAELAERARASQPHGASSALPKLPLETPQPSSLLPASDRVGDVALAFLGTRSRPFALGAIGLVAISLLALVIWLGRRGPDEADGKTHATMPSVGGATTTVNATVNAATPYFPHRHPPDNDPVWKVNPGGESLFPFSGKTSAGTPVKFASKMDVVSGKKTHADLSLLLGDVAANVADPHGVPNSQAGSQMESQAISHDDSRSEPRSDVTASTEPPSISAGSTNQSALNNNGVVSAKDSSPGLSAPTPQEVTGGQLLHRVAPVYPAEARSLRLEGTVILAAVVTEDGTVGDVNVVEGAAVLAQSAVDAVKHWRYQPYELDGKPLKKETRITIDFKFPSDAGSH